MPTNLTLLNILLLAGLASSVLPSNLNGAQAPRRLRSNIDDSQTFVLKDSVRPAIALGVAQDQGAVSDSQIVPRMTMHFAMTSSQEADLTDLLKRLQDRRSPDFHKFLTLEEYAARFGLNTADVDKVKAWLESRGFTNIEVANSRTWVSFSGSAGQTRAAFQAPIHKYSLHGESHYANSSDIRLPKALQGVTESVRGLNDFRMKPRVQRARPQFTSNISGNTFLTPDDWATIYNVKPLYGQGFDGTGVTIAVVGQSNVNISDIQAFRSAAGLPAKDPTVVLVGTDPGIISGDAVESDLDLEWAGGIAKNANILLVTARTGVFDAITYAVNRNLASIVSISYGLCETDLTSTEFNSFGSTFAQGNALGITFVVASGDSGPATCDTNQSTVTHGITVDFPSALPYLTAVGGTTFNEGSGSYWSTNNNANGGSALSYIPEIVWNEGNNSASGGGASLYAAKPSWQTGVGVPNDGSRDVPDIAFAASGTHDGYLICSNGWCTNGFRNASTFLNVIGGTSAGAPSFAGVLALLIQKDGGRLGNINPNLYSLAAISSDLFHDITSGSNIIACQIGTKDCSSTGQIGYAAGTGYDEATGWGSVDAYNLVQEWHSDYRIAVSPGSLTVARGTSGTATVTVTAGKSFTGTVSFKCSVASPLTNVTCAIPGTVSLSGATTLTITAGSTAALPFWQRFRVPAQNVNLLLLSLMCLVLIAGAPRKPRSVLVPLFLVCLAGCGKGSSSGGSTPTPLSTSQTGVITVIATSGQLTNTATLTVTVP